MRFHKLLTLLALTIYSTKSLASPALMPEDGSGTVRRWFYSSQAHEISHEKDKRSLNQVASYLGIELKDLGSFYSYIQDIMIFDESGNLLEQAQYPDDKHYYDWLTMGVMNEDAGFLRITPSLMQVLGIQPEPMLHTIVEGGALITGRFEDRTPYAITTESTLWRTQRYLTQGLKLKLSPSEIKAKLAQDLRVAPKNLFVIPAAGHLDLFLMALPNGRLLMHDPRKVATVVDQLLKDPLISDAERKELESIDRSVEAWETKLLDQAAEILSHKFQVTRVAGVFKQKTPYSIQERINFLNGFQGRQTKNSHWQITNSARNAPSLERYWRELVQGEYQKQNKTLEMYFIGQYLNGAGIDCVGAIAP